MPNLTVEPFLYLLIQQVVGGIIIIDYTLTFRVPVIIYIIVEILGVLVVQEEVATTMAINLIMAAPIIVQQPIKFPPTPSMPQL
jgi:hypothetical protein